ncbi:MAG TPA: hypothetical protein G4N96_12715 [Chloroflexi bacterium]|nr:hypothetical protein [Chloroflexota bacterium]
MNYDLTKMQENLRAEFETILQFVTGTEAQTALEIQALKPLSSTTPQPVEPNMTGDMSPALQPVVEQKSNIAENPVSSTPSDYYALPLVVQGGCLSK